MKRRLIIVFIAFLALPFLMTSCKKDEDPKDQITYNGETFELSKGYIYYLGSPVLKATGYEWAVFVASSEVIMPFYDPPLGTGNWAGFWLYSSSSTAITPGTYEWAASGAEEFTFDGSIMLDSFYGPMKSLPVTDFASGTLKVSGSETNITVSFTGTLEGGDEIKVFYSGPLMTIEGDMVSK